MGSAIVSKVACLCAAAGFSLPQAAAGAPATRAQTLFDEARDLMREGNFADACPRLAESQRLEPGGGTLLNLALCWEKAGRLGRAAQTFAAAEKQAIADGREDRRSFAVEHLGLLLARAPKAIIVGDILPKGAVRVDGELVPISQLGEPRPLDPGQHTIQVSAPGYVPWSQKFAVFERETKRVEIPPLESVSQAIQAPPGGGRYEMRPYMKKQVSDGALTLFILGGASVVAGGVTGMVALAQQVVHSYDFTSSGSMVVHNNDTAGLWGATGSLVGGGALMILVGAAIPKQEVEITPALGGANLRVRW